MKLLTGADIVVGLDNLLSSSFRAGCGQEASGIAPGPFHRPAVVTTVTCDCSLTGGKREME